MKIKKLLADLMSCALLSTHLTAVLSSAVWTPGRDNWSMSNFSENFWGNYYLSENDRDKLFGSLKNTEKPGYWYFAEEKWGGSCYGMAASSVAASHGLITDYAQYTWPDYLETAASRYGQIYTNIDCLARIDQKIARNYGYGLSDNTESMINYFQYAGNICDDVWQYVAHQMYHYSEHDKAKLLLEMLDTASPDPVLLCYFGDSSNGHAVVAYGVEYVSYFYNGNTYDRRILIYDPNLAESSFEPEFASAFSMYINSETGAYYFRYDKYIQICKNLIYLYCDIPHEISSCFIVSDFAGATFV